MKMLAFAFFCFVSSTCAANLGYNYQPIGPSGSGIFFGPESGNVAFGIGSQNVGFNGIDNGIAGGNFDGESPAGGSLAGNLGDQNDITSYNTPVQLEKEFFTFTAPEQEFDDGNAGQRIVSSGKQSLRVIFIKGPENKALENTALNLAKQAVEQKTAIYVLNKQDDVGDLAKRINIIENNISNKPKVHFVKYRTPEDAFNAQRVIKSQYNALGGTSQSQNGGNAPVINFASQLPAESLPAHFPDNSYLPSSIFYRI